VDGRNPLEPRTAQSSSEYNENMSFLNIPAEKWDGFAPYGSGIGSLIGYGLFLLISMQIHSFSIPTASIIPISAYILCTCTHRKNLLFSKAALAGTIGSIIGGIILTLWLFIFPYKLCFPSYIPILFSCNFYIPFYMSRYVCQSEHKSFSDMKEPIRYLSKSHIVSINFIMGYLILSMCVIIVAFQYLMPNGLGDWGAFTFMVGWIALLIYSMAIRISFGTIFGFGIGMLCGSALLNYQQIYGSGVDIYIGGAFGGTIGIAIGGVLFWLYLKRRSKEMQNEY